MLCYSKEVGEVEFMPTIVQIEWDASPSGIMEVTSSLLRDKLGLDKEAGRDQVRRIMRKLEKARKVIIGQKEVGRRKQYVYKLER